jgi:hypothetical protein
MRPIATALPKAGAKPEGRSDQFIAFVFVVAFIFRVFRPKNACQALKPPNPFTDNNIRMAC